ncbi:MAG: DUF4252 domain-containing protein [Marinilabiliaceae bacterium]|jgi:hypothetical protein|nr:DUF4252 domain-containing protein [Marinilabiliaceae bacterium]
MKRLLSIAVLALFTLALSAQSSIDRLFNKYQGQKGFTTVTVNGNLLKMFADNDDEDDEDLMKFADKFTSIRILAQEDDDIEVENFYDLVIDEVNKGGYEELVTINSEGDDVKIMIKADGKIFREFLLIAGGDENAIIQIKGSFTYNEVKEMSKSVENEKGISFSGLDF